MHMLCVYICMYVSVSRYVNMYEHMHNSYPSPFQNRSGEGASGKRGETETPSDIETNGRSAEASIGDCYSKPRAQENR